MRNKPIISGKYVTTAPTARLNKLRLIALIALSVFFIVPPLVFKLKAMRVFADKGLTAPTTAYVLLILFTAGLNLYCFIACFTRYRLRTEIPAANAPKLGFTKHTWSAIEWLFYLTVICACAHLALTVYAFSPGSLAITLFAVAAAACAYFVKRLSFIAYKDALLVSLDDTIAQAATTPDTTDDTAAPDTIDDTDFYNE